MSELYTIGSELPALVKRNKFVVTVKGDINDGDYMTKVNTYEKKTFDLMVPLLLKIGTNEYNTYNAEKLREELGDEWDYLCDVVPGSMDYEAHTAWIESIIWYNEDSIPYIVTLNEKLEV